MHWLQSALSWHASISQNTGKPCLITTTNENILYNTHLIRINKIRSYLFFYEWNIFLINHANLFMYLNPITPLLLKVGQQKNNIEDTVKMWRRYLRGHHYLPNGQCFREMSWCNFYHISQNRICFTPYQTPVFFSLPLSDMFTPTF